MKKNYILLMFIISLFGCKEQKNKGLVVEFKDEFVLQDSLAYKNTIVGGLSGIDYDGTNFYFVIDDSQNPRILKSVITFNEDTIQKIDFVDLIELKDSSEFYKEQALDLESLVFNAKEKEFHLVSEGSIKKGKEPSVFAINEGGEFISSFEIPEYFKSASRHNASFEGSCRSIDNTGMWVAMEGVLKVDGEEPSLTETLSPVRITLFNDGEKKATKQYVYMLDKVEKPKKGTINLNGLTAILEYKKNTFLVVERAYQSGYGSYGNTVKLYKATVEDKTTNTLAFETLSNRTYIPLKKELLLNFNTIKPNLTKGIIDNIEGITLGPKLSNGNSSLILISDDNFQLYDTQINQFIVLEIKEKN
ncbi:esterase-like activity of phytase family protein [Tenacibaculum amylolyticum]|uniref:esterase-like activity of phytase family protein n=1 Tax=Tenacibaculum amylolyticum TaxID=104269 RepID=UPI0038932B43